MPRLQFNRTFRSEHLGSTRWRIHRDPRSNLRASSRVRVRAHAYGPPFLSGNCAYFGPSTTKGARLPRQVRVWSVVRDRLLSDLQVHRTRRFSARCAAWVDPWDLCWDGARQSFVADHSSAHGIVIHSVKFIATHRIPWIFDVELWSQHLRCIFGRSRRIRRTRRWLSGACSLKFDSVEELVRIRQ